MNYFSIVIIVFCINIYLIYTNESKLESILKITFQHTISEFIGIVIITILVSILFPFEIIGLIAIYCMKKK